MRSGLPETVAEMQQFMRRKQCVKILKKGKVIDKMGIINSEDCSNAVCKHPLVLESLCCLSPLQLCSTVMSTK